MIEGFFLAEEIRIDLLCQPWQNGKYIRCIFRNQEILSKISL